MKLYGFKVKKEEVEKQGIIKYIKNLEDYAGVVQAIDDKEYYLVYEDNEIGRLLILLIYTKFEGDREFRVLPEENIKWIKNLEPLPEEIIPALNKMKEFIVAYYKFKNPYYILHKFYSSKKSELDEDLKNSFKQLLVLFLSNYNKDFVEDFVSVIDGKLEEKEFTNKYYKEILKGVIDIEEFLKSLENYIDVKMYLGNQLVIKIMDNQILTLKTKSIYDTTKTKDGKRIVKPFLSHLDIAKILSVLGLKDIENRIYEYFTLIDDIRSDIEEVIRRKVFAEALKGRIAIFEDPSEEEAVQQFIFNILNNLDVVKIDSLEDLKKFNLLSPKVFLLKRDNHNAILVVPSTAFRVISYPRKVLKFLSRIEGLLGRRRPTSLKKKRVWVYLIDVKPLAKYFPELKTIEEIAIPIDEYLSDEEATLLDLEKALEEQKKQNKKEELEEEIKEADGLPDEFLEL